MKYTLEQFKQYLDKQDSLGDVMYNLKNFESFLDGKTHYIVGEDNLNDFFVELEDHQGDTFFYEDVEYEISTDVTQFIRDYSHHQFSQIPRTIEGFLEQGLIEAI